MKKSTDVIIKLDGSFIDDGIDLFELAPSLLSIGTIVNESQKVVFPKEKEVGINIKPFKKGSFIIEIALFTKNVFDQIFDIISREDIQKIKTLLEWIGLIKGSVDLTALGLIGLVKWLKGKPKKIEKLERGDVKVTNNDNVSITVNKNVYNLYKSPIIRKNIYSSYGKLLEQEGIEKIESYLKEKPENNEISSKEDLESFSAVLDIEEVGNEHYREMDTYLKFKRGSFAGETDNWSFWWNENIINTTIKDEEFIKKVRDGTLRPNHKDLFRVILGIKQVVDNGELLRVSYDIIKVLEYKKGPAQLRIPKT